MASVEGHTLTKLVDFSIGAVKDYGSPMRDIAKFNAVEKPIGPLDVTDPSGSIDRQEHSLDPRQSSRWREQAGAENCSRYCD